MIELDPIDKKAAAGLEGYLVRKDLVRTFSRQFPVPTYVVEFLLGRYCASTDQEEIAEGLEIVQRQLADRTVKAGEEELFKSRAREKGQVKIIDLITARLDAKTDSYLATIPTLRLQDARIEAELVSKHERMLTGGFYAEITLVYDSVIEQEKNGRPFGVESLREIQLSKRDVLDTLAEARNTFTTDEWKIFLLRSIGIEPDSTPELQSDNSIGGDPLEPGQAWSISPGGSEEQPGLYRIEINEGPGSGIKILNKPVPLAFKESMGYAEQNLYARSMQLVGDKEPRHHEFTVQLRAFDASKSGAKLGMASLLALCTSLLKKSIRGGLIIVGEINLGGSIEPIHNPVAVAEIAVEKGATAVLMPVSCRRQLFDLSDDMATRIDIQFYSDSRDALLKARQ